MAWLRQMSDEVPNKPWNRDAHVHPLHPFTPTPEDRTIARDIFMELPGAWELVGYEAGGTDVVPLEPDEFE